MSKPTRPLRTFGGPTMTGRDVRRLQNAANDRLRARGQDDYLTAEDGVYGPHTVRACHRALYLLGLGRAITRPAKRGDLSVAAQLFIIDPDTRGRWHKLQAARRMRRERKRLKRLRKGRHGAVRWAKSQAGIRENPPGSNKGGKITEWQRALGAWLVGLAWCGVFCAAALRHAGVNLGSRPWLLASVSAIEDLARAGAGPFTRWTTNAREVRPGDFVVLFGRGVHVEFVVEIVAGAVKTVGGNTSAGSAGSQSNGGMVAPRTRPLSDVHGFAIVNYA